MPVVLATLGTLLLAYSIWNLHWKGALKTLLYGLDSPTPIQVPTHLPPPMSAAPPQECAAAQEDAYFPHMRHSTCAKDTGTEAPLMWKQFEMLEPDRTYTSNRI